MLLAVAVLHPQRRSRLASLLSQRPDLLPRLEALGLIEKSRGDGDRGYEDDDDDEHWLPEF